MKMLESNAKDPAIKLFGKQIPLSSADDFPSSAEIDSASAEEQPQQEEEEDDKEEEETQKDPDHSMEKSVDNMQQDDDPGADQQDQKKPDSCPDSENPKTPSINEEAAKPNAQKEQNGKPDSEENQKAALKKPDKILPCPRCNSMDTKFCYYNNYNVNQPRHFCKACQRYWTAGGTMRNVPVGAGRRKSKSSSSHNYRHVTISEALQAARIDAPNGTHGIPDLTSNGTVLRFGVDAPAYNSVMFSLDKKVPNGTRNGFHNFKVRNHDNCSSGSSVTVSSSTEEGKMACQKEQPAVDNLNGFAPQIPCLPWPYPWSIPVVPGPGISIPYYGPVDFWNCASANGAWNVPWLFPREERAQRLGSDSLTLGKHSREENEHPEQKNGCVLVPKILRVNDPTEAAKSTIWSTLGIKNEAASSKGGLFNAFQTKWEDKSQALETTPVLCANPAALSRSIKFHESS